MCYGTVFVIGLSLTLAFVPAGCLSGMANDQAMISNSPNRTATPMLPPNADLRINPENGTVRYLKLSDSFTYAHENPTTGQSPAEAAVSFIDRYKVQFKLERPREELKCLAVSTDDLGLVHVRFQQVFNQVDVWGREINVHLTQSQRVNLVQGQYIPTPNYVNTKSGISISTAVEKAISELGLTEKVIKPHAVKLVIFAKPPEMAKLAWEVTVSGWRVFVDANSGEIIERISMRQTNQEMFIPMKQ